MENFVIEQIIAQGIFALLFVWLFIDTRKDTKDREKRYQQTIEKLSDLLYVVKKIEDDVENIKNKLDYKKKDGE